MKQLLSSTLKLAFNLSLFSLQRCRPRLGRNRETVTLAVCSAKIKPTQIAKKAKKWKARTHGAPLAPPAGCLERGWSRQSKGTVNTETPPEVMRSIVGDSSDYETSLVAVRRP